MGEWELHLPLERPLTMNDNIGWRAKSAQVKTIREAAYWLAKEAGIPKCDRISVQIIYTPATKRRRDPINIMATAKPVEDGLVDARVVPDDTPEYLLSLLPIIASPSARFDRRVVALVKAL